MIGPSIHAERVDFDLTGLAPNPSVNFERVGTPAGHGDMSWTIGYATVRFDCSILGAAPGVDAAVPGSQGSVTIRLGEADLRRLRDAIDAVVGLADDAGEAVA